MIVYDWGMHMSIFENAKGWKSQSLRGRLGELTFNGKGPLSVFCFF